LQAGCARNGLPVSGEQQSRIYVDRGSG
jgi:hypothetical protein